MNVFIGAVMLAIAMGASAFAQETPRARVRALSLCPEATLDQSSWQTVSFETLVFKLPPDFRQTVPRIRFAHGGNQWSAGGVTVRVTRGWWGNFVFDTFRGAKCRLDVEERSLLVDETISRGEIRLSLPAWELPDRTPAELARERGGSTTQPLLTATSSNPDDLPLLRAIIRSLSQFYMLKGSQYRP